MGKWCHATYLEKGCWNCLHVVSEERREDFHLSESSEEAYALFCKVFDAGKNSEVKHWKSKTHYSCEGMISSWDLNHTGMQYKSLFPQTFFLLNAVIPEESWCREWRWLCCRENCFIGERKKLFIKECLQEKFFRLFDHIKPLYFIFQRERKQLHVRVNLEWLFLPQETLLLGVWKGLHMAILHASTSQSNTSTFLKPKIQQKGQLIFFHSLSHQAFWNLPLTTQEYITIYTF